MGVGFKVGLLVGSIDPLSVGFKVGLDVGSFVGFIGLDVGLNVGFYLFEERNVSLMLQRIGMMQMILLKLTTVGLAVGLKLGPLVGFNEGLSVGLSDGYPRDGI